jgi:hypothetical protein
MNELYERSNITSRHAGCYTIMEQPQSSCVNLQHASCTNITHRSSHDIEAILIVGWVPIFWEVWVSRLVEISTLMTKTLNSIGSNRCNHYTTALLVTNPCTHELASPRRLYPCKRIENTSKNRKKQSQIADEWLAHESWGLTNRMSVKLFLTD